MLIGPNRPRALCAKPTFFSFDSSAISYTLHAQTKKITREKRSVPRSPRGAFSATPPASMGNKIPKKHRGSPIPLRGKIQNTPFLCRDVKTSSQPVDTLLVFPSLISIKIRHFACIRDRMSAVTKTTPKRVGRRPGLSSRTDTLPLSLSHTHTPLNDKNNQGKKQTTRTRDAFRETWLLWMKPSESKTCGTYGRVPHGRHGEGKQTDRQADKIDQLNCFGSCLLLFV